MLKKIFHYNPILNKIFQKPEKISFRWSLIIPVLILVVISLITLKHTSAGNSILASTFIKQIIWLAIGFFIFLLAHWLRIQYFQEYAFHLYFLLIIMISVTYFMPIKGGSQRWIIFGPIFFQPSEIGKLLLVFILARILSEQKGKMNEIKLLTLVLFITFIPALMVFNQPDFGTAIVYGFVSIPMLYWSGIRSFYLFSIIAPFISIISAFDIFIFSMWMGLLVLVIYFSQPRIFSGVSQFILNVGFGILSPYIWNNILYEHQKDRIMTLLNPASDPQGSGYQVIQSIIAIGSGGLWGKGVGEGTQTQLRYLPVRDTDFIISVIGEEMGLFGILIILMAFFIMLYWMIIYAGTISNSFSSLTIIGFASILFSHFIVNMGMTVGLFPVTGLPAPFLSYGGSFLLSCILIIALSSSIINNHI